MSRIDLCLCFTLFVEEEEEEVVATRYVSTLDIELPNGFYRDRNESLFERFTPRSQHIREEEEKRRRSKHYCTVVEWKGGRRSIK